MKATRSFDKDLTPEKADAWKEHQEDTRGALNGQIGLFRAKYGYLPKAVYRKRRHEVSYL